jgi:Fe-S-cluster containining protein
MNDVYKNPAFLKELEECIEKMKVLTLYPDKEKAYLIIRDRIEEITQSQYYKSHVTCGSIKNCSFCCHDRIIMGKVEAKFIKNIIVENDIKFNVERAKKQSSGDKISWADKACPLLQDVNEQGERLCSIYENRPLICRTHNSVMNAIECNKEHTPNKTITEAKVAVLDAYSITAISLENKEGKSVNMHDLLLNI